MRACLCFRSVLDRALLFVVDRGIVDQLLLILCKEKKDDTPKSRRRTVQDGETHIHSSLSLSLCWCVSYGVVTFRPAYGAHLRTGEFFKVSQTYLVKDM